MFSKKMVMIVGVVVLIAINIIILSVASRRPPEYGPGRVAISIVAPFQEVVARSIRFVKNIWNHYFFLVQAAKDNDNYKKALSLAVGNTIELNELRLSNIRLRNLLDFQKTITSRVLSAEVIGKDPSLWFKTIIIDKGKVDGVNKGMAVVIPEGIVGQVTKVSLRYSQVLLMIDRNSAVDVLVQRTRARGLIKGESAEQCLLQYVLRKYDVEVGDIVVSSGLDGVFPKGLGVGQVSTVVKRTSGVFQDVSVTPFVDFEKLEEVLVILNPQQHEYVNEQ